MSVLVAAGALLLSACGGGASGEGAEDALRVGVLLSLTGPAAPFGTPEKEAVETIAEMINEDGGIDGRKIELYIEDDKTDPTEAAKMARKLMLDDQVHAIVGATTGSATLASGPIAMANKVPMVAPNGTIAVTDPDNEFADWIYRSSINDLINIENAVNLAADNGSRIGIFYQEDAYGEVSKEHAEKMASESGGAVEVVETASAALSATDVAAQATKLVNADPDVVLVQVSAPVLGGAVTRALKQVRFDGLIIVAGGLTSNAYIEAAGNAAEGVEAVGALGFDQPSEGQQQFMEDLREGGYGEVTGFAEAIGVGAFYAIVEAAKNVDGEFTGEKIRDALDETCYEPLHHGPESCFSADNHDGMTTEHGAHMRVQGSKWVTVTD